MVRVPTVRLTSTALREVPMTHKDARRPTGIPAEPT